MYIFFAAHPAPRPRPPAAVPCECIISGNNV